MFYWGKRTPQLQTITVKHIWETYTPWIETFNLQCSRRGEGSIWVCKKYIWTHMCLYICAYVCVEARDCHGMSPNCSPLYLMRQGLSVNPEITDSSSSASQLAPRSPCWLANKHGDEVAYHTCLVFMRCQGSSRRPSGLLYGKYFIHQVIALALQLQAWHVWQLVTRKLHWMVNESTGDKTGASGVKLIHS